MNEEKLIARAAKGDASAFNDLLSAHERKMYAVCLRMCGNHEDAQDCLQEAMLRVFRAISGFKGQSSFSTWLYRVTMNTCLDELRKKRISSLLRWTACWRPAGRLRTPRIRRRNTLLSLRGRPKYEKSFGNFPMICAQPSCCAIFRGFPMMRFRRY